MNLKNIRSQLVSMNHTTNINLGFTSQILIGAAVKICTNTNEKEILKDCLNKLKKDPYSKRVNQIVNLAISVME